MILWLAAIHAAQDPAVQRTVGQLLLTAAAALVTLGGAAGILWWLVWPRIRDGIENIVVKVNETHKSVTVNGGKNNPPTLRDELGQVREDVKGLIRGQAANVSELRDLHGEVSDAKHIAEEARDTLQHHVASGERYLGQVQIVLKEHGIEIPPGDA